MKAAQVDTALIQKFIEEDNRIVFWNDANAEFSSYIERGLPDELSTVTVLDMAEQGGLSTKLRLEREDCTEKYLLYRAGEVPPAEEDWLLDIRLYSAEFHADVASIWLQELGLSDLYLRKHLRARQSFLGSQERRRKLGRLIDPDDNEAAIDLKMIAVLSGSDVAGLFSVLRALCHGHIVDNQFDLESTPPAIEQFAKMGLADCFWSLIEKEFGYSEKTPTIAAILRRLLVSELVHEAGEEGLESLGHFLLSDEGKRNAVVFLTQWRDSKGKANSYDAAALAVEEELKIREQIGNLKLEALAEIFTFWAIEMKVVAQLRDQALEKNPVSQLESISATATSRKAGYWLSNLGPDQPERIAVSRSYDAIVAAVELFDLATEHGRAFSFENADELLAAYRNDLYRFDQLYRHFCFNVKFAKQQTWGLLKKLTDDVEGVYEQAFLQPFSLEWGRLLEGGFLETWKTSKMPAQHRFYENTIGPYLRESGRRRAFVIISDAFRYEAAEELTSALNGRYRMDASLGAMLGVLPSYTTLGMASLLPSKSLAYRDNGDVLADGKSVSGTETRSKQLDRSGGMACQASDLMPMKTDEARDFTSGKRVIYIYHNVIDARGDSKSTEDETFAAVNECIVELADLVKFCVNKLNAATVWVTADHGFLFQESAPDQTDKSELTQIPERVVKKKKRYIIGHELGMVAEAHHGWIRDTAGIEDDMEYWIPRGTNRFHFQGGARFIHGGAMPQEIVIPLVKVTQLTGKKKVASRVEKVSVQVLGNKHKITTPKYRFELIQTEAVSDRRKPITLRAAVYDGATAVTSIETVTFDSVSESIDERKKTIRLELLSGDFDKKRPYRLVLRDSENDREVLSMPVVIDRSFDDDF